MFVTLYFKIQFSLLHTINYDFYLNTLIIPWLLIVSKVFVKLRAHDFISQIYVSVCFIKQNRASAPFTHTETRITCRIHI